MVSHSFHLLAIRPVAPFALSGKHCCLGLKFVVQKKANVLKFRAGVPRSTPRGALPSGALACHLTAPRTRHPSPSTLPSPVHQAFPPSSSLTLIRTPRAYRSLASPDLPIQVLSISQLANSTLPETATSFVRLPYPAIGLSAERLEVGDMSVIDEHTNARRDRGRTCARLYIKISLISFSLGML